MFTYQSFIEELGPLVETAITLKNKPQRNSDDDFRRWRHQLTDLISQIQSKKYRINCNVASRHFDKLGGYSYTPRVEDRMAVFNRDLDDTITELQTLISNFTKYGDPNAEIPSKTEVVPDPMHITSPMSDPTKLLPPERITLAWLWEHTPLATWLKIFVTISVIFSAGVALGQSQLYSELISKLTAPATTSAKPSVRVG